MKVSFETKRRKTDRTTFLIVTRTASPDLSVQNLNSEKKMETEMLLRNHISGLCPIMPSSGTSYCYDTQNNMTLNYYVKSNSVSYLLFSRFFRTLCRTFSQTEFYLLSPDCFLLRPDLIFLSPDDLSPRFCYFPASKTDLRISLEKLCLFLLKYTDSYDGSLLSKIHQIYHAASLLTEDTASFAKTCERLIYTDNFPSETSVSFQYDSSDSYDHSGMNNNPDSTAVCSIQEIDRLIKGKPAYEKPKNIFFRKTKK